MVCWWQIFGSWSAFRSGCGGSPTACLSSGTADRVAMRQDGRTIVTGTHDELLAVDAGYRRLPASQVGGLD
jgi:hypothetical protein